MFSLIKNKKWYFKIWKRLNSYKLKKLKTFDLEITFDDLFNSSDNRKVDFFLGAYSKHGIDYALKKYKLYSFLNKNGFKDLKLITQLNNPYKQRIALYNIKADPANMLAELVAHKKSLEIKSFTDSTSINGRYEFLAIEWLCLQNPYTTLESGKILLPGQKHPGLGIGRKVLSILFLMAWSLKLDGIFNIPEYYHNAVMYSKKFHFIDPEKEGIMLLIKQQLDKKLGLPVISWAIDRQFISVNNEVFKWFSSPQIITINKNLEKYIQSSNYKTKVNEIMSTYKIHFDIEGFKKSLLKNPIPGISKNFI